MTDQLIDSMVAELKPVGRTQMLRRLVVGLIGGGVVAAAIMIPWIGLRADLASAVFTPIFWGKFTFTALLMGSGLAASVAVSRPRGRMRRPLAVAILTIAITGVLGIVQLLTATPDAARTLVLGGSALVCPFYILTLSIPIYFATVLVMRRFAPTNLAAAGFAAGLLAGGAAAFVYAFHCGENGLPFITLWYSAGILGAAVIGMIIGRTALRW
jgi:hypothetical protein